MKLITMIIFFFSCNFLFSQYKIINDQESMIYNLESINTANELICKRLYESKFCSPKDDSVYIYHYLQFQSFRKIKKEDFLDNLFFKKLILQPQYLKFNLSKKKSINIPNLESFIFDSEGNFLGKGDFRYFYCKNQYNDKFGEQDVFIIKQKERLDIRVFFKVYGSFSSIVYGRTYDDKIIVFHSKGGEPVKISSIEEFVEKYWDEYWDK